ncbi:MAG: phage gp6-like head-tail connector protein [Clostridia bacterium]|nr:phage gp6-like head-tail connector protein [Clostridia bacterium]
MAEETIKDWTGRIIGYIETKPNGDKVVRAFSRRILGYYYKNRNVTTDFYGRVLAQGDCCGMLIGRE